MNRIGPHIRSLILLAAALVTLGACSGVGDESGRERLPVVGPATSSAAVEARLLRGTGGDLVPQADMEAVMASLARDVALALADPGTRSRVHQALDASKVREHKVHFRTLLRAADVDLLAQMGAQHGGRTDLILARLDSVVDLEFYMPVPSHRDRWNGGTDLIVVSYPNDDGAQPRGFDLQGREVPVSALVAPDIPTLVLVPVETDFRSLAAPAPVFLKGFDLSPRMVLDPVTGPQWYMRNVTVNDTHEGWALGSPELEVHDYIEQTSGTYTDRWCAGEGMPAPYSWNMDSDFWGGGQMVTLATDALVGTSKIQYQMWEDDNTGCRLSNGQMSSDAIPKATTTISGKLTNLATLIVSIYDTYDNKNASWKRKIVPIAVSSVSFATIVSDMNPDDFVGEMKGPANQCWPADGGDANYGIYSNEGANYEGNAYLNTDYGVKEPICGAPPLAVSLSGPSTATTCASATYHATAGYGVTPYSYAWTYSSGVSADNHSADLTLNSLSAGTTQVQVTVTDAVGAQATQSMSVSVTGC